MVGSVPHRKTITFRSWRQQGKFGTTYMNNKFIDYLETLTPSKRMVAREAVEVYIKGMHEVKTKILSSEDIFNICRDMELHSVEHFDILLLNQANRMIKRVNISTGGIDQTTVDVRVIMKHCLVNEATQVACVHNHPSGNIKPSTEDIKITNKIKTAGDMLNIRMIDHIIMGDDNYYSFHDNGLI